PPPHHDIYSIEDLAELIFDLKNANNKADINVKLVSEAGVGTIATGVAKGGASLILISGHDGGTGASPLSSIYHAGLPLELGLAETQQTLLRNGLRSRVRIEADGKLMTGRDVAIACLLGAEEFGFATAPLIAMGCLMQRACHQDTCPIGIATQNRELRSCFRGKPEYVENFMLFVAREMREYMAELGFRTVQEMVGHVECLEQGEVDDNWKAGTVDLSQILEPAQTLFSTIEGSEIPHYEPSMAYDYELETILDETLLLPLTAKAIEENTPVEFTVDISNVNRCVGTVLGSHITRAYPDGLSEDLIKIRCVGSGGQSFGAFVPKGIELSISGDANDYFGKGLSGGTLSVTPPSEASFVASENMIIGNVAFYGATSGKGYINGVAGQRFAVRNSGAELVVEGVDNHGCEYMTGGIVLVLGPVGINFAAGMSGGIAYVYDAKKSLEHRLNPDMVDIEKPDDTDRETIHRMITEHVSKTGSPLGIRLLYSFDKAFDSFKKVIPRDYKKILALACEEEACGKSRDEALVAAFERVTA
ncbi:MAG: glutamate synthase subunit alpha, partial [Actinobacteria bacterium]|nr:glutamate synthase subunit alpha [Actinomycetota bacterium]